VGGEPTDGPVTWSPEKGPLTVGAETTMRFDAGAAVPVVAGQPAGNAAWLDPGGDAVWELLGTYSLLLALLLGTMGLPHILVRFYTNPDGISARRTTLHVLLFVGLFAVFPILLAVLARLYVPQLLVTGDADAAVLLLPSAVLSGLGGQILTGIVVAGMFSAFLAAASGLVLSVAGVVATGLLPERLRDLRLAAVLIAAVALGLALVAPRLDLAHSVGYAFALAASTFCPVLVLGIWWRGLTPRGAGSAMVVGALLVLAALGLELVSGYTGGWAPVLVQQPALVSVPVAFLMAIVVSNASRSGVPADVDAMMLRMHAPDSLGFLRDRDIPRYGRAEERMRFAPGRHRRGPS
ncbi:MAG: sodium:solute symporter family transporter, partial [Thermocrispum sp.]